MNITRNTINVIYKEFLEYNDNMPPQSLTPRDCAKWLQENYFEDGTIMGYYIEDNPTAIVGKSEGGHDVLVVQGYIIDFWARPIGGFEDAPILVSFNNKGKFDELWYGDISKFTTNDNIIINSIINHKILNH